MSTHTTPGPSRRRRIAGERKSGRPAGPGGTATGTAPTYTPPSEPDRVGEASGSGEADAPALPRRAPRPKRTRPAKAPKSPRPAAATKPRSGLAAWWGSRASLLVLAGVLVLVVAVTSLLALGLLGNRGIADVREADTTDTAGREASAAAERAASAILAYDYQQLDADQTSAEHFMTPAFVQQYERTFERVVKPAAEDSKAKVTAEVQGSSVVRAAPDRVRVLLFVDQTTLSTANQGPQQALNRVEFDMVERSGTWLVDDVSSY